MDRAEIIEIKRAEIQNKLIRIKPAILYQPISTSRRGLVKSVKHKTPQNLDEVIMEHYSDLNYNYCMDLSQKVAISRK